MSSSLTTSILRSPLFVETPPRATLVPAFRSCLQFPSGISDIPKFVVVFLLQYEFVNEYKNDCIVAMEDDIGVSSVVLPLFTGDNAERPVRQERDVGNAYTVASERIFS